MQLPASRFIILVQLACSLLLVARPSDQLRFASVQIPSLVQYGTNFWLACSAELANQEQLYSVKWYRANEEFYRVISDGHQATAQHQGEAPSSKQQQQYFGQAGVSVRMGASNATHVQMLNASIESEGSYACEISTQNLSTIRYEKELKVYVLPQSRLAVSGFKSRYALGERVELVCSSNFSRPRGALAWFINDLRISRPSELFELDASSSHSADGSLTGSKLGLRFRLSAQLLAKLLAAAPSDFAKASASQLAELGLAGQQQQHHHHHQNQQQQQRRRQRANFEPLEPTKRNYSQFIATTLQSQDLAPPPGQRAAAKSGQLAGAGQTSAAAGYQSQSERQLRLLHQHQQQQQQQPLRHHQLRLQCKYRLTEISDVTFNELVAVAAPTVGDGNRAGPGTGGRQELGPLRATGDSDSDRRRRRRQAGDYSSASYAPMPVARPPDLAGSIRVSRTLTNQIVQDKCPASERGLRRSLGARSATVPSAGCSLGSLALQPDDPLISAPAASDRQPDFGQTTADATGVAGGLLELKMGQLVALNCLTIAALTRSSRTTIERDRDNNEHNQDNIDATDDDDDDDNEQNYRFGSRPTALAGQTGVCLDEAARRRLLVSGKSQVADQIDTTGGSNNSRNNSRPAIRLVAQLVLAAGQDSLLQLVSAAPAPPLGAQSPRHLAPSAAPPLLEWFINNQEATKSSGAKLGHEVRFEPTAGSNIVADESYSRPTREDAANSNTNANYNNNNNNNNADAIDGDGDDDIVAAGRLDSLDGARRSAALAAEPSIDYFDYFANFDGAAVAQQQRLALKLPIDRHHFSTPDSRLRLRCSSTQAQLLMADSVQLNIALVGQQQTSTRQPANGEGSDVGWQKRKRPSTAAENQDSRTRPGQARHQQEQQQQQQQRQASKKTGQQANGAASKCHHRLTFCGQIVGLVAAVFCSTVAVAVQVFYSR